MAVDFHSSKYRVAGPSSPRRLLTQLKLTTTHAMILVASTTLLRLLRPSGVSGTRRLVAGGGVLKPDVLSFQSPAMGLSIVQSGET